MMVVVNFYAVRNAFLLSFGLVSKMFNKMDFRIKREVFIPLVDFSFMVGGRVFYKLGIGMHECFKSSYPKLRLLRGFTPYVIKLEGF